MNRNEINMTEGAMLPKLLRGGRMYAFCAMVGIPSSSRKETTASPVPSCRIVS